MAKETWKDKAIKIVEAEPELPGPMPDELQLIPLEDALRAVCRATKKSIARAIRDAR
jgi:hypothetical protein